MAHSINLSNQQINRKGQNIEEEEKERDTGDKGKVQQEYGEKLKGFMAVFIKIKKDC